MVSDRKLKFYAQRVEEIRKTKADEIRKAYPEISIDRIGLIAEGKGELISEEEIRGHAKNRVGKSCYRDVDLGELFRFKNEMAEAKKQREKRDIKEAASKERLQKLVDSALNLVYLGTEEQLLDSITRLQAFKP